MRRSSRIVVVAGLLGALGVGGAAYALWTATGSGSGSAKALTAQSITATTATATAQLYPGGPAAGITFDLSNPNPYEVTLTTMTAGAISSSVGSCNTHLSAVNKSGLSLVVPAGGTLNGATIPGVVSMASGAPDACQGIDVTLAITLSGGQS